MSKLTTKEGKYPYISLVSESEKKQCHHECIWAGIYIPVFWIPRLLRFDAILVDLKAH